jgi:hypothetical protein
MRPPIPAERLGVGRHLQKTRILDPDLPLSVIMTPLASIHAAGE